MSAFRRLVILACLAALAAGMPREPVGVYRGQPAVAVGYFRHLGDQVMVSVGGSTTGNEWSANTGVTFSW